MTSKRLEGEITKTNYENYWIANKLYRPNEVGINLISFFDFIFRMCQ